MSKMKKKKRHIGRKILFGVEILVLILLVGVLFLYTQINKRMDSLNFTQAADEQEVQINESVAGSEVLSGYTNIALFGVDKRAEDEGAYGNSDTAIIASINNDTKEVKLVSVYRDTLLNLGDGTYSKANAAYAYGGPEQAITMLNTNLDLNITDYATVNFNALATIVDCLGGLDMDMSYAEIVHMNNYCVETAEDTGLDYTPIELPPEPEDIEKIDYRYHLNGVQVTSYCRIRFTASLDMGRTERQRKVIQMIVQEAKKAGLGTIFDIMDEVFPMVSTSVNKTEILQLLPTLIGYSINETTGFPTNYKFANISGRGSLIVPTDLDTNVAELHKFLYGDEAYTPSSTVKTNSERILEIVGGADNLDTVQTPQTEDVDDNTTIFFQNDGSGWTDTTDQIADSMGDTGYEDPGTGGDTGYEDPGTGGDTGYEDPGSGGGYEEPDYDDGYGDSGSGGGYEEPDYDGGYDDPGSDGGYDDPGSGDVSGGDTGDGGYDDSGDGGYDDSGSDGDYVDPGTEGGDVSGGDTGGYVDESGGDVNGGDSGYTEESGIYASAEAA